MTYLPQAARAVALMTVMAFAQQLSAQEFDGIAETYVDIAFHVYGDTLTEANILSDRIDSFLAEPTEANLDKAKSAWINARKYYSQTEAFRFAHPVVDEWEIEVNSWPLDEGFIDYVDGDNYFYELGNPVGKANIIASKELRWGANQLDLSELTPELLGSLNELGGTEANVATGWHAIEFLLWGQDLHGTEPGAGERPASDYATGDACTHGNCERRAAYLKAVTELLVADLEFIVGVWDSSDPDAYASEFLQYDKTEQMRRILYGMGSLALGELAGERMKVALYANSTEDEHDCFSDNTHNTLYNDALSIDQVLRGKYRALDGSVIEGPSLMSWIGQHKPLLASQLDLSSAAVLSAVGKLVTSADNGMAFDQMIAPGNTEGSKLINDSIESLKIHTRNLELLAEAMQLGNLNPDNAGHQL